MIYLFCNRPSDSARALVAWLNENGVEAAKVRRPPTTGATDLVVNWGVGIRQAPAGVWLLNRRHISGKYAELQALQAGGIPVPDHHREHAAGLGWLARRNHHQAADDLVAELQLGDYYVEYVPTIRDVRVHVFNGVSIRSGVKVPRVENPHPRFRSWETGWKFDYGRSREQFMRQAYREVAKQAVAVLGYDFGAVDIGVREDGRPIVWEVNSAPGLEGGSIAAYGNAVKNYYEGGRPT